MRRRAEVYRDPPRLSGITVGPFRRRDLKDVMAVEQVVFPDPWSLRIFTSELALKTGRAYRVARAGRALAGYLGVMFVEDEAHVTTLAVAPGLQGRGVGKLLMLEAVSESLAAGAVQLSLEVAVGNERAQALYRRFGMAPVGVRKGYYPTNNEDALIMVVRELDSDAYAARVREIAAELLAD